MRLCFKRVGPVVHLAAICAGLVGFSHAAVAQNSTNALTGPGLYFCSIYLHQIDKKVFSFLETDRNVTPNEVRKGFEKHLGGSGGSSCWRLPPGGTPDDAAQEIYAQSLPKVRHVWMDYVTGKETPYSGGRRANSGGSTGADIVIEDAKPAGLSAAELQEIVLEGQREDAARRAKTVAASLKENAEVQAELAKFLEKERKRGRSQ